MLNIAINLETGLAKPSQSAVIKAGGAVPVRITFSSNPGDNPVIELALSAQSSAPAVVAYLGEFEAQNQTVYEGSLDGTDFRLLTLLSGKQGQTLDCEIVLTRGELPPRPFPNFPVAVQSPIITGPSTTEGGPVYLTQAQGDVRYLRASQLFGDIAPEDLAAARSNLGLANLLLRQSVALPSGFDAAGSLGQYHFDSATGRLWVYTGAQWGYFTLITAA